MLFSFQHRGCAAVASGRVGSSGSIVCGGSSCVSPQPMPDNSENNRIVVEEFSSCRAEGLSSCKTTAIRNKFNFQQGKVEIM
jgi:hypothetical protein